LLAESGWHNHHDSCQLLCLHQTIEGARVGPSGYTFQQGEDVIPRAVLPEEAAAVLSGHIHREQVLHSRKFGGRFSPPVIYPGSIERTSFAERDERKGYYDITLEDHGKEQWKIGELKFIELPARPMADLVLKESITAEELADYLRSAAAGLDSQAIVRLRCDPGIDPEVKRLVTSRLLREVLPGTMNYQFSSDFRRGNEG
jgi:exonuclease SbcD